MGSDAPLEKAPKQEAEEARARASGQEATVIEELPSLTFVVELANRQRVRAHMAAATKLNATRLRVKDKVLVEVSPHDPTRGRIVKFLRAG